MITLIVILTLVVAFGIVAHRFGYDSRDSLQSNEQELARYGFALDAEQEQIELARELAAARSGNGYSQRQEADRPKSGEVLVPHQLQSA